MKTLDNIIKVSIDWHPTILCCTKNIFLIPLYIATQIIEMFRKLIQNNLSGREVNKLGAGIKAAFRLTQRVSAAEMFSRNGQPKWSSKIVRFGYRL